MGAKIFSIAKNTFLETIRQPIYGVILLATALLMVFNVSLAAFTLDDDNVILKSLGLSTLLMSGLFLAAFSATGILYREIENKTVLTVVSKPVGRASFILGKFAGLAVAMGLAYYLCSLAFLLSIRHGVLERSTQHLDMPVILFGGGGLILAMLIAAFCNYFFDRPFTSTCLAICLGTLTIAGLLVSLVDNEWNFVSPSQGLTRIDADVVVAVMLVFLAVLVLAAVALAASSRLGQVMTLMVCVLVLMLGVTSDYMFGQFSEVNVVAMVAYWITPNMGMFWVADALGNEEVHVTSRYLGLAAGYAGLYIVAAIMVAVALFQNREVG